MNNYPRMKKILEKQGPMFENSKKQWKNNQEK